MYAFQGLHRWLQVERGASSFSSQSNILKPSPGQTMLLSAVAAVGDTAIRLRQCWLCGLYAQKTPSSLFFTSFARMPRPRLSPRHRLFPPRSPFENNFKATGRESRESRRRPAGCWSRPGLWLALSLSLSLSLSVLSFYSICECVYVKADKAFKMWECCTRVLCGVIKTAKAGGETSEHLDGPYLFHDLPFGLYPRTSS